jgi:hypothetical protein
MRHFAMSKGETIVQVHGALPFTANRRIRPKCCRPTLCPEQRRKQNGNSGLKDSGLLAILQRHEEPFHVWPVVLPTASQQNLWTRSQVMNYRTLIVLATGGARPGNF